ncbi:MAG: GNAT family N-acetyltransferase [Pseudomonadota bacterium]
MTDPRCTRPPTGAAAETAARFAALVPVLEGPRLRLRAPSVGDLPAWQRIYAAPEAKHFGGPWGAEEAWEEFAYYTGDWILYGHGLWSVERLSDTVLLGFIHLGLEWSDPEPELGWMFLPEHRGQGYATEAAGLASAHGAALLGDGAFVSYIAAGNAPSNALAARLGARRDTAAETAIGATDLHVWRHGARP